ncbi:hypothetical protein LIER_06764 [Lithospermum erythrorhizon]|uniref:Uncharacterized protein n=1 Tax=Lithospermum erythrorhizon TaxID=34254 RepID=A0AAV3PAB8_LITER
MLAPEAPSSSVAPTPVPGASSQPMGPEGRSSPFLPTLTPADQSAVNLEIYKSVVERLKKTTRELQVVNEDHEIHITEAQKMLNEYYDKVCEMEAQIEELHRALDTFVEKFKRSEEYHSLLKGDTATLLRNFCQKVAADFPGISSHLPTSSRLWEKTMWLVFLTNYLRRNLLTATTLEFLLCGRH